MKIHLLESRESDIWGFSLCSRKFFFNDMTEKINKVNCKHCLKRVETLQNKRGQDDGKEE